MKPVLSARTRLRAAAHVHSRPVGEERVVLDFARGEYFALDPVGALIWEMLASGATIGEMAERVVKRYDVSLDQAEHDTVVLMGELLARSLAVIEPS